jgi:hypothetical protein
MATYQNLFVDQGSDFSFEFNLNEAVSTDVIHNNLDSLDLSGYTARGQIKRNYAALTAVDFEATIDVDDKLIIISLPAATSQAMKATRYVYDIQLVSNDSPISVLRVFEGQVEVFPGVTTDPIVVDDSPNSPA